MTSRILLKSFGKRTQILGSEMKKLFLLVLLISVVKHGLAAKFVELDSATIKECFVLGYCDFTISDPEELPRTWVERNQKNPVLRIRIMDLNENFQMRFACREGLRDEIWEYSKFLLKENPAVQLRVTGKLKGTHAAFVKIEGRPLTDWIMRKQFRC